MHKIEACPSALSASVRIPAGARSAQALSPESAPGPEFDLDRLDPIRRSPFAYAPGTVFTCIYLYTYVF